MRRAIVSTKGVITHPVDDLQVIAAPVTGLALILAVWVWGGRAGWASWMIVPVPRIRS